MRTRGIVFALSILAFLTLGGCNWYLTDDGYYYDDDSSWFCEGEECWQCEGDRCWPDAGACTQDADCAEGCYCVEEEGYCEETGWCDVDEDCREGFECDDRSTCVPGGDPDDDPTDPPPPPPECESSEDCDAGQTCSDAGTCEPTQCTNNSDCPDGSVCDLATGECVPGEPDAPVTCDGPISCDIVAPNCTAGDTPEVAGGCFTGECVPSDLCVNECSNLRDDENSCNYRTDCLPVYSAECRQKPEFPTANCTQEPEKCECGGGDGGSIEYLGCLDRR